jgi:hypothetical protein
MTTPAPGFRALCAKALHFLEPINTVGTLILTDEIKAALAALPPEPPTDEEIATAFQKGADQEFYATVEALTKYCDAGVELTDSDAREVLYELRRPHIVLDHWGNEKQ